MKLLKLSVLALFFLFPTSVFAQTTSTIAWTYLGSTLAEIQGYNQQLSINGAVVTAPINCAATGSNVNCTVTIAALPSTGTTTIRISATLGGVTKETSISGINPASTPKDPVGFRYVIQVNVNIP